MAISHESTKQVLRTDLTLARLQELLSYDPETGQFRWRVIGKRNRAIGAVAGTMLSVERPYLVIGIDYKRFLAHRLAWLYMTGEWPTKGVDHINGKNWDNRWSNLREASQSENCGNARAKSTNTSGYKGVYPKGNKWVAQIMVDGIHHWLGSYTTPEDAAQAYRLAAGIMFGEFAKSPKKLPKMIK